MNSRKRMLTPTEQLQNMIGMYKVKDEEEAELSPPQSCIQNGVDESYEPIKKRLTTKSELWVLFDKGTETHYFCTLCNGPQPTAFKKPTSSTVATRHVRRFHSDHPRVLELLKINPDFLKSNGMGSHHAITSNSPTSIYNSYVDSLPILNSSNISHSEVKKPKQAQFESAFVRLLSNPEMDIKVMISSEMQSVLKCLDPKMSIPSDVSQLNQILLEQSTEIKQNLRSELNAFLGSISATIGVWSIEDQFGFVSTYISVMVHLINQDRLQHKFLGSHQLTQPANISHIYKQILNEYGLELDNIYRTCVTGTSKIVDSFVSYDGNSPKIYSNFNIDVKPNISNKPEPLERVQLNVEQFENDSTEEYLNEIVKSLNDEQCHRCISHDLKLVLFNTIKETLVKTTEFQRMIGLFYKFQKSKSAISDLISLTGQAFTPIRSSEWSSWISALEYYHQHHNLMAQIAKQQNWERLAEKENNLLQQYLDVLSVFRYSIKTLENNENPSLSWVYGINRAIFEKLNSNNGNKQIQRMCEVASQQMRQKLSYVQDDPIIMMSTFLDPATKRHLKPADAEKATELVADWLKLEDAETSIIEEQAQEGSSSSFSADPLLQMLDSFEPRQSDKTSFVRSFAELISAEFQRQPDKGKYSSTTLQILKKSTTDNRYERIIKIACVVLAVPTSNKCPESRFIRIHNAHSDEDIEILNAKLIIYFNYI